MGILYFLVASVHMLFGFVWLIESELGPSRLFCASNVTPVTQIHQSRFFNSCKKQKAVREAFRFTRLLSRPTLQTFNMLISVCREARDVDGKYVYSLICPWASVAYQAYAGTTFCHLKCGFEFNILVENGYICSVMIRCLLKWSSFNPCDLTAANY